VLLRVKKERNLLQTIRRWKTDCIGHILGRTCLLKHVIEGKIEGMTDVTGRQGRRRKHVLDDFKERRRYLKFIAEALHRNL
jgi:hypothetical protein